MPGGVALRAHRGSGRRPSPRLTSTPPTLTDRTTPVALCARTVLRVRVHVLSACTMHAASGVPCITRYRGCTPDYDRISCTDQAVLLGGADLVGALWAAAQRTSMHPHVRVYVTCGCGAPPANRSVNRAACIPSGKALFGAVPARWASSTDCPPISDWWGEGAGATRGQCRDVQSKLWVWLWTWGACIWQGTAALPASSLPQCMRQPHSNQEHEHIATYTQTACHDPNPNPNPNAD